MEYNDFLSLNLSDEVLKAIEKMGFTSPTLIQQKAIPLIKSKADVIGKSQTGTGKTLAFAVPGIEYITPNDTKPYPQVLILCPTRELAMQSYEQVNILKQFKREVKTACIYGGASMSTQINELKNANFIIGTPGRVIDHIKRKTLKLGNIKMVVLDEADEMLSMGFKEDMEEILNKTPKSRQTVLFSATMSKEIMSIADEFLTNPEIIEIDNKESNVGENITQTYVQAGRGKKKNALVSLMQFYDPKLAIVFCNTKRMVDELTELLLKEGFRAQSLHGDINQNQRQRVMHDFKSLKTNILVATDVAARGIDVNDVEYIINYDIPQSIEYYVHRIGRTARAGKMGSAITIVSGSNQISTIKDIAKVVKAKIKLMEIPNVSQIKNRRIFSYVNTISQAINTLDTELIEDLYAGLIDLGYSPKQIAKGLLAMEYSINLPEEEEEVKKPNRNSRNNNRSNSNRNNNRNNNDRSNNDRNRNRNNRKRNGSRKPKGKE